LAASARRKIFYCQGATIAKKNKLDLRVTESTETPQENKVLRNVFWAAGQHYVLFGGERLLVALRSCAEKSPQDLISAVLRDVRVAGAADPSDDIAALACRWHQ
jgi:hypothetical protein